jgi:hypothetical protein
MDERPSSRRSGSRRRWPGRWCRSTRWRGGWAWSRAGACSLQIDCNSQAALSVVARADFAGDDVFSDDYEPSPEVRRMFVPFAASGDPPCVMSMFQVRHAAYSPTRTHDR